MRIGMVAMWLWMGAASALAGCPGQSVSQPAAEHDDSRDFPEPEDDPAPPSEEQEDPATDEAPSAEEQATPEQDEAPPQQEPQAPAPEAPKKAPEPRRAAAPSPRAEPEPDTKAEPKPEPAAKPAPAEVSGPCGDKGQPSCPLQGWMEKNVDAPMERGDLAVVAKALRKAAGFAPDPTWNQGDKSWRAIATTGSEAAASGDTDATKKSCKSCHRAWRKRYKAEHRKRVVP